MGQKTARPSVVRSRRSLHEHHLRFYFGTRKVLVERTSRLESDNAALHHTGLCASTEGVTDDVHQAVVA